jgi:hypothetical protein
MTFIFVPAAGRNPLSGEKSSFTDKRKSKFIATFFNAASACQSKPAASG